MKKLTFLLLFLITNLTFGQSFTKGIPQKLDSTSSPSFNALRIVGINGSGYINYIAQSATPSIPSSGFNLYANSANALSWVGANGYTRTFDGTSNTANRVYTLPNVSGTIALTSDIAGIVSGQVFKGLWNASTNSPTLTTTPSTNGDYYIVSFAGTQSITGSSTAFSVNDKIISNGTVWVRTPDITTSIQAQVDKNTVTSYSTATDINIRYLNEYNFTTNSNFAVDNKSFILTNSTHGRATVTGYVSKFYCYLTNTEVGRKVRYYVLRENTAGNYTVISDSGLIDSELAGLNSYTPTLGSVPIQTNDVLGIYIDCISTANSLAYYNSGGPAVSNSIYVSSGALTVGSTYSSAIEPTSRRHAFGAEIVQRDLYVSNFWANKPNGYPKLNSNSELQTAALPYYVKDSTHTETTVTEYLADKSSTAIVRNIGAGVTYTHNNDIGGNIGIGSSTFTKNLITICWNASNGFTKKGILTEVRVSPVIDAVAGAKLQIWIVRPSNISTSTPSFTLVSQVGEMDAASTSRWHIVRGLYVPVEVGDMVAVRGIDVNLPFWSGASQTSSYKNVRINASDLTMNAFSTKLTGTTEATARNWIYEADIISTNTLAANTPYSLVRTNASGYIPTNVAREEDLQFKGKKIIWVGTSIPAGGSPSYPSVIGRLLNTQLVNESVGSSGMAWNGTRALTLSATQAELTAAFGGAYAVQSYESKLIGKAADYVVFDHGHNDRDIAITNLGTINSTDRATFYGSFNYVINALLTDNPNCKIIFITPPNRHTVNNTQTANMDAVRNAIIALADKYNAPIIDLMKLSNFNTYNYSIWTSDGIHPTQSTINRIAYILANELKKIN